MPEPLYVQSYGGTALQVPPLHVQLDPSTYGRQDSSGIPASLTKVRAVDIQPPQQLLPDRQSDTRYSSDKSKSRLGLFVPMLYTASTTPTVENAQQEPHDPWFFTGVIQFWPLKFLQSKEEGAPTAETPSSGGLELCSTGRLPLVASSLRPINSVAAPISPRPRTQTEYSLERGFLPSVFVIEP